MRPDLAVAKQRSPQNADSPLDGDDKLTARFCRDCGALFPNGATILPDLITLKE